MTREIKFRAWDKKEKVMREQGEIYFNHGLPNTFDIWDSYELMQYTGLKDRNGKEIYEGDIVNYNKEGFHNGLNGFVEWFGSGFYIAKHIPLFSIVEKFKTDIEIIGNIYQNPEILSSH